MALEEYRDKRHFDKTPEPAGDADGPAEAKRGGLLYVIQKHAARQLHYDFRLELDGTLLSWAVPKGPSLDPRDRHLAARVEDHPLEYGSFEGTIPHGEYGAGTVELWDRGTWEPESDPHQGLAKGDLKFMLHGEKLKGSWVLVRMKPRRGFEKGENWLLIKHRDEFAVDGDGQALLRDLDRSVASGRNIEEIAAEGTASIWHGDRPAAEQADLRPGEGFRLDPSSLPGARAVAEIPRFVQPELATLVEAAPEGDAWVHEVKFDGYRALSRIEHGRVEIYSRSDRDWTEHFKLVAEDLARLPADAAMLDGEVVVQMPDGSTSFQELQRVLGSDKPGGFRRPQRPATDSADPGLAEGDGTEPAPPGGRLLYYAFDLLFLNGYELLASPIEARKELLKRLLSRQPGGLTGTRVRYSDHVAGGGEAFLHEACRLGLEGIVSKRAGSGYRAGVRGSDWQKSKCRNEQEFVIGGYTDPGGSRQGFGALLLGVGGADGLRYVGKVGTGFDDRLLRTLAQRLRALEVEKAPFDSGLERAPKGSHWVQPTLVAEVAFSEWTRDGGLRHPSFKGLREDKVATEVTREKPDPPPAAAPDPQPAANSGTPPVVLTHPERVFWPGDGVTKQGLAEYYRRVAPWMLPYVVGRPVAMVRCPEGVEAGPGRGDDKGRGEPCFFHKHPGPDFKGPFEVVTITESEGPRPYLTITEPESLTALVQMGVLEVHVWGATWPDIERPDVLVFDLDPDAAVAWETLAEAARLMREVLRNLGLETFVKTTGGKGLHVVAPITPWEEWPVVHAFSKAVAEAFAAGAPDRYTANMSKSKRAGKIFLDYVRNTRGSTSVAPYSTRARERATVSVPLGWEELDGKVRPDFFTVTNIGQRLDAQRADPWEGYHDARKGQTVTGAMRREVGLG
jgi:bifunctional non-homologous end joining protein LigD